MKLNLFTQKCNNMRITLKTSIVIIFFQFMTVSIRSQCNLPFSTQVPKLNITFYDNREMCKCCNERQCQSSYLTDEDALKIEMARYNYAIFLEYKRKSNPSKEQENVITKCLTDYMVKEYGSICTMKALFGDLMYTLFAGTNLSTNRRVGRYTIDSGYCSKRCENDSRCQD